jgi:hypothetical protein
MLSITQPANAGLFGPNPGDACKTKSEAKKIDGKKYICDLNRDSKLTWIPNYSPTNSEKATALAFAGCTQGNLTKTEIYWYPRLYLGAIINYGYAVNQIKYNSIFDLDIWKSDYISSTFIASSSLDKSWSKLSTLWETGLTNSLNKWKAGGLDGIAAINASQTFDVQITSICKVVLSKVNSSAQKYGRSNAQYVVYAVENLLPTPFGQ